MINTLVRRVREGVDRSERGDTLIEVLLAIIVLGLSATALLVAFALSISSSGEHRTLTTMDTALRSAAEQTTSLLQAQGKSVWATCPSAATQLTSSLTNLPSGYTATVSSVQYWSGGVWSSTCTANAPQFITLKLTTQSGLSQNINFIVSDPYARPVQVGTVASQLIFVTQPGNSTAGSALPAQPVVEVADTNGYPVTSDLSYVTLSIKTGPTGSTLSNCKGTEFYGVITFTGCSLTASGTYTITASDNVGIQLSVTSASFTVNPASPTQFAITSSPVSGTAALSTAIGPITVQEQDVYGNPTTVAEAVNLTSNTTGQFGFSATPGGALVGSVSIPSGSSSVSFYYGDTAAGSPTITASGVLTSVSQMEMINAAAASEFVFTSSPVSGTAASSPTLGPITVQEADVFGNPTTTAETVTLSSNSTGTVKFAATSGGPSVTSVSIPNGSSSVNFYYGDSKAGTPTITASGALTSATQTETIAAVTASKLIVTGQPAASTTAGSNFTVAVSVEDPFGNVVPASSAGVTLAMANNPGSATLYCVANPVSATNGVATFTCWIYQAASGYTLTASSTGLTSSTTSAFAIVAGTPSQFNIVAGASGAASATATVGPITVQEQDAFGNLTTAAETVNLASSSTGTVKFAATSGGTAVTSVAIPSGSSSVNFYYGDTKAGTPTLTASGALTSDTQTVTINAATASKFVFTASASGTASSSPTIGPFTVQEQDTFGNPTTTAETVNLSSNSSGTVKFAATSGGTSVTSVAISSGSSSVNFYYADSKAGSPTITASGSLTSATQSITISAGTASAFNIVAGASGAASATATVGPITVQEQDAFGNPTTTAETVNLSSNSTGTTEFAATSGGSAVTSVAIPSGSSSVTFYYGDTKAGTPTLTASGALTSDTQTVTITAAAPAQFNILAGATGPASASATVGPITVQEQDAFGNPTTTAETVNLASNSTGTVKFAATSGGTSVTSVAIPSGSSSKTFYYGDTKAGTPTLTASGALTSDTQTVTITSATASKFVFTASASGTASSSPTIGPFTVQEEDAFGNLTTTAETVNLASNSSGTVKFAATSGGTSVTSVAISSGSSSVNFYYADSKAGSPTITASGSLTSATESITISAGSASKVGITSAALTFTHGTSATNAFTMSVEDSFGNATTVSSAVTINLSSSTPGSGTAKFAATSGGTSITSISLPANAASVTAYYAYSKSFESPVITVSATGYTSSTQTETSQ